MIKLEAIHKEMNNKYVQQVVKDLYLEWMWKELDYLEDDPVELRKWATAMFTRIGAQPTQEQLLAAERLFQSRIERAQPWYQ